MKTMSDADIAADSGYTIGGIVGISTDRFPRKDTFYYSSDNDNYSELLAIDRAYELKKQGEEKELK